jgi:hypothetical protein
MYEIDEYTVSLLHFDDGIKDETGKVWTAKNGASVSTAQSKFGNSSLYLNGINQYLVIPYDSSFDFSSGDFTVEFWVKFPSAPKPTQTFAGMANTTIEKSPSDVQWGIYTSSGIIDSEVCSGQIQYTGNSSSVPSIDTWYHVAIVKNGTTFLQFINGILTSSTTCSATLNSNTAFGMLIGVDTWSNAYANCYMDEFRISKIARWSSNFDPNVALRALLVVTMSDDIQKEYDLSMDEINAFTTWYDTRAIGTGLPHYIFNKDFNLGPFQSRKDYLVFDKIENFEVMEYTK